MKVLRASQPRPREPARERIVKFHACVIDMDNIPPDLVLDELPGPKRGQAPALYFQDEVIWSPDQKHFALAYTIMEVTMMNNVGLVLWGSFDGHKTTILGNLPGLCASCWERPWCKWLKADAFVFKAQGYDGRTCHVPLVVIHVTKGFAVLAGMDTVDSRASGILGYDGPFETMSGSNLLDAIRRGR